VARKPSSQKLFMLLTHRGAVTFVCCARQLTFGISQEPPGYSVIYWDRTHALADLGLAE